MFKKTLYSAVLRFPYWNEWYGFVFIFSLTGYTRYTGFFLGNFSPEAIVNHVNPVGKKGFSCSIRIVNIGSEQKPLPRDLLGFAH
jgi:hypothetical protein